MPCESPSAAGNIRECLQQYINQRAQDVYNVVAEGQEAGLVDPELSAAAISQVGQAAGIGVHLLLPAGLDQQYVPTEDEWHTLVLRLISGLAPPDAATP